MPPKGSKKRKAEDEGQDEEEERLAEHLAIGGLAICSSAEMVNIFVGERKECFPIHRDLLALHSKYFDNYFSSGGWNGDDKKFNLHQFQPEVFVDFKAWLYTGKYLMAGDIFSGPMFGEQHWTLGKFLQAPGFQNCAMEALLDECRDEKNHFLYISDIASTYQMSQKGDLLRDLAADRISCENPMYKLAEGSKERKEWEDLIETRCPELASLIFKRARVWAGKYPWDPAHRHRYMEKELDLDEVWHRQLLQRRTRDEIKREAKKKCIRSMIELAHLDRSK